MNEPLEREVVQELKMIAAELDLIQSLSGQPGGFTPEELLEQVI